MPLGPRLERSVRATVLAARMLDLSASLPRRRCRFSCSCWFVRRRDGTAAARGAGAKRQLVWQRAEQERKRARADRDDRRAVPCPGGTARAGGGRWSEGGRGREQDEREAVWEVDSARARPARARALGRPSARQRTRRMMKGRPYSSNASDMVAAAGARTQGSLVSALSALNQFGREGGFADTRALCCAGCRFVPRAGTRLARRIVVWAATCGWGCVGRGGVVRRSDDGGRRRHPLDVSSKHSPLATRRHHIDPPST